MIHTQHNKKQHIKNKFRALEREDRQRVYSERLLSHANARKLNHYNTRRPLRSLYVAPVVVSDVFMYKLDFPAH